MAKTRRARSDADKSKRKEAILKTAWKLYEEADGQLPTVSRIAMKADLSKGTIYLYFRTKEEIYLQLFVEQLSRWIRSDDYNREFGQDGISEQEFAELLTRYLQENPLVLKLCSIVKGVLEENINDDIIIEAKVQIAEIVTGSAETISRLFPQISRDDAIQLMLQIYSVISGLWQFVTIPERTRESLLKRGVDVFEIDFFNIVQKSISSLIKGTIEASGFKT